MLSHLSLDFSNLPPSLQTELSLQKEQLQLKIIEIEDEAEKWQKEKDRIKVSSPRVLGLAVCSPRLSYLGGDRHSLLLQAPHLCPTLTSGFSHPSGIPTNSPSKSRLGIHV